MLTDIEEYQCIQDRLPPKWMCSRSRDLFKFGGIGGNVFKMVQNRYIVAIED